MRRDDANAKRSEREAVNGSQNPRLSDDGRVEDLASLAGGGKQYAATLIELVRATTRRLH
jgi:hypothetical protein